MAEPGMGGLPRLLALAGRLLGIDGRLLAMGGRLLGIDGRLLAMGGRLLGIDGRLLAMGGPWERRCPACGAAYRPEPGTPPLCAACLTALPVRQRAICPHCGEFAAWPDLPPAPCARCLLSPPPWTSFVFYGPHEGLLRRLLLGLKFGGRIHLAPLLGELLANQAETRRLEADAVLPIPLHPRRLVERGYNQSLLLARPLARRLGLPLAAHLLNRSRHTAPQTGSDREARRRNLQGAFCAHKEARGKHILLIDDTMTTGATLAEACRCLQHAGAARVDALAVSRTPARMRRADYL